MTINNCTVKINSFHFLDSHIWPYYREKKILCVLNNDFKIFNFDNGIFAGKRFLYWNGTEPRLCLTDSGMIKEFLGKYSTISGKSWQQQQGSKHFIGRGLLMANGEDWYHQRHLVAPAFMGEKLKVFNELYIYIY